MERTLKPPTGNFVFSQMTKIIRALAIRFILVRINAGLDSKVNAGLDDIRQLIDWDVQNTVPADKLPYLACQDIRITNSHQQGAWTFRVTTRNLKTNKDVGAQSAFVVNKTMIYRVTSPQQQWNLSLSAPHRLLVIGIRRCVFENFSSIEELFDSDLDAITVKPEFLEQPILIARQAQGCWSRGRQQAEKKNRDRVLRRQAFLALRREMVNLHRRNQTQKGRKIRTTEILVRATHFNKRLIQASNSDEAKQPEDVSDLRDDQFDDGFPEPDDDRDEDEIGGSNNTGEDEDNAGWNETDTGQASVEAYLVTIQGFQSLK
ncbi:hypothetical protein N0V92_000199 [Colletotrichum tropicale]|nr:hypothetical protein N0V92_000199 [Colletotrichum tropicale]